MSNAQGIFLNGRQQIIEMLQIMPEAEKEKLLYHIRLRNPSMAQELMEESLSFKAFYRLSNQDLSIVLNHCQSSIVGVALKNLDETFQRQALGVMKRDTAEKAYQVMLEKIANEDQMITRARSKMLSILVSLWKQKMITL